MRCLYNNRPGLAANTPIGEINLNCVNTIINSSGYYFSQEPYPLFFVVEYFVVIKV